MVDISWDGGRDLEDCLAATRGSFARGNLVSSSGLGVLVSGFGIWTDGGRQSTVK
jgi:hypothetical protein